MLPCISAHSLGHLKSSVGRIKIKKRVRSESQPDSLLFTTKGPNESTRRGALQPDEFINLMLKRAADAPQETELKALNKMIKPFEVYWQERQTEGHIPEAREGAAMVVINRRIFLFGGLSRELYNDIRMLRTDNWCWSQVNINEGSELPPEPRLGHVMLPFKHKLVIYGGCGIFDKTLRIRQCFSRVHIFDTGNL